MKLSFTHSTQRVTLPWKLIFPFLLLIFSNQLWSQSIDETMPAGAYIINMSAQPQTIENGIKPYGLIYELLSTEYVPIKWIIKDDKTKDAADFYYEGTAYKAGPFIITANSRTAEVNAIIAKWEGVGVQGVTTTSPITVPVYSTINYSMTWTLDAQNGGIAEGYLSNADLPETAYNWVLPNELDCCNDVFVMPHADPVWESHGRLLTWNDDIATTAEGCDGAIWAACHAVSALENAFNPANPTEQLNFLSNNTGTAVGTDDWADNSLILWGDHDGGSYPPPYVHDYATHPVMQFMGLLDGAQENGSEQMYIPKVSGWRPETKIGVYDGDHIEASSTNPEHRAAKVAFGAGFGNPARGKVMYEAGHSHNGSDENNVAAQRAFFNFSFWAAAGKAINVSTSGMPTSGVLEGGVPVNLSVSATGGTGTFNYEWIANCAGTFSNPVGGTTTFTPDLTVEIVNCVISVIVQDDCGTRTGFSSEAVLITPPPTPPVATDDNLLIQPNSTITFNPLADNGNGADTDLNINIAPTSLSLIGSGTTTNGVFSINPDGTITYVPNTDFLGLDSIQYEICDDTPIVDNGPFCATATIVVNVSEIDEYGCTPTQFYGVYLSGNADLIHFENSISNGLTALGSPDLVLDANNYYARLDSDNDELILDLTDVVPAGASISIYMGTHNGDPATLEVESNLDGVAAYTNLQSYTSIKVLDDKLAPEQDIFIYTTTADTRYLRFKRAINGGQVALNGIVYILNDCLSAAPTATNDEYTICETNNRNFEILENDADPQNLALTVSIVTPPINGIARVNTNKTITFIPNDNYIGLDSFTYQICNEFKSGYCSEATVTITGEEDGCPAGFYIESAILKEMYAFGGNGKDFWKYDVNANIWTSLTALGTNVKAGGALVFNGTYFYGFSGDGNPDFWRYDVSTNNWTTLTAAPDDVGVGGDLVFDGTDIYAFGGNGTAFWKYSIATNSWTVLASLGVNVKAGGALTYDGTYIYGFSGDGNPDFWRYDITTNTWAAMAVTPDDVGVGADLYYEKDHIYALAGNSVFFWKYDIAANSWTSLANLSTDVKAGGSLSFDDKYLYATIGNGNPDFFRYDLGANTWATMTDAPGDFDLGGSVDVLIDYGCNGNCVTIPNRYPLAFFNEASVACGGATVVIDVQADDIEPEGEAMTTTLLTAYDAPNAANTVTVLNNDSLSVIVGANFIGVDTFAYQVCDVSNNCDTAFVFISVANCPPTAQDDIVATPYETAINITVLTDNGNGIDSDLEGGNLTITTISTDPANGIASINNNATPADPTDDVITYTPYNGYMGTDSLSYVICDGDNLCDTAVVYITVVNEAPVAVDDPLTSTNECSAIVVYPLANDTDAEDGSILITNIITQPANGLAELKFSAQIAYYPDFGFSGLDQLTYEVCDDGNPVKCDTATVFLSVADPQSNGVPVPQNDTADDIPLGQTAYIPVLTDLGNGNDIDPEGTKLTVSLPTDPQLSPAGSGTLGTNGRMVTFTPSGTYVGLVTFTYQVCDTPTGYGSCPAPATECATATVSIMVTNQAPIATGDNATTGRDLSTTIGILSNDFDPDGGQISLSSVGNDVAATDGTTANGGTVSLNDNGTPSDPNDDFIDYTPPTGFIGTDNFSYKICDDVLAPDTECDITTVSVIITPPIDLEVNKIISSTNVSINDTISFTVSVFNNNIGGGTGDATGVTIGDRLPSGLTYVSHTVSAGAYDANSGSWYIGDMIGGARDTLIVQAILIDLAEAKNVAEAIAADQADKDSGYNNDSGNQSEDDEAAAAPNSPPVAINDTLTSDEDNILVINSENNDFDIDGDDLTIAEIIIDPSHGTAIILNGDSIQYTPTTNYVGLDSLLYRLCDSNSACDTAWVYLTIDPVNDKPSAVDDTKTTDEDVSVFVDVQFNDSDLDGDLLTTSLVGISTQGVTASVENGDSLLYTPPLNFNGKDTLHYQICDNGSPSLCDTAQVIITITPTNDLPLAVDDTETTDEDISVFVDVQFNDSDLDGDVLTTSLVGISTQGVTASVENGDSLLYTPPLNFNGKDTLYYQICDNGSPSLCDTAQVIITINPTNDKPLAVDDVEITDEDVPVFVDVQINDSDLDGDLLTTSLVDVSTQGVIASVENGDSLLYTPPLNFNGKDTLHYQICDNGSPNLCDTAQVIITINPTNDPPAQGNENDSTPEDTQIAAIDLDANNLDLDGDVVTVTVPATSTQGGAVVDNTDGTIDYTPALNFNGLDTVFYTVCDPSNACVNDTLFLTVTPVNDPPAKGNENDSTPEDTQISAIDLDNNNLDLDGDVVTVTVPATSTQGGAVVDNTDGTIDYTPALNFNGLDIVFYTVCDPSNACVNDTLFITVTPVNDPPAKGNENDSTPEDTPITSIDLDDNNLDLDGDAVTVTVPTTSTQGGVVVDNTDGTIDYTPALNFNGLDTVFYTVCDPSNACVNDTLFLTVTPVNDPPAQGNENDSTPEDTQISAIDLDANNLDLDGDVVTVTVPATSTQGGAVVDNTDGTIDYTPALNFNGLDTVFYTVCDPSNACVNDTLFITVTPVNDPPAKGNENDSTPEDTPIASIDLDDNNLDLDGDTVTVTVPATSTQGGVVVDNMDRTITYTPALNFNGLDTVFYTVCDPSNACVNDTLFLTITPVNDSPIAANDVTQTLEDTPIIAIVQLNDSDPEDSTLTTAIITNPINGLVTVLGGDSIEYTPSANFHGLDTLVYQICDNESPALCDTATLIITVNIVNDAPIAVNDYKSTEEDTPVFIAVQLNDNDIEDSTLVTTLISPPTHGNANVISGNDIGYSPSLNYTGMDTLSYKVCDNESPQLCDTAEVIITINPVNDKPVAVNDLAQTPEDTPIVVEVQTNDSDIENGVLITTIIDLPKNGTATLVNNDSINYIPDAQFFGLDTLFYQICDNEFIKLCDTARLIIDVQTVNDAPIALNDFKIINEDAPVIIDVQANDSDIESTTLLTSIITPPTHGNVNTISGDSIGYSPELNYSGMDTVVYQICDTGIPSLCDTAFVVFNINPINDAPIAANDFRTIEEDQSIGIDIQANDNDAEGGTLTTTIIDGPDNGSVIIMDNDSINYTPALNFHGYDTLSYQICDSEFPKLCDTAQVVIGVGMVNDAPIASNDIRVINEDTSIIVDVQLNDSDAENSSLITTIITSPTHGNANTISLDSIGYIPNLNYTGLDTLIYQLCDTDVPALCDTALVIISINPVNDAPVAINDNKTTLEDTPVIIDVQVNDNDVEGSMLTTVILSNPSNGQVALLNGDSVNYTPDPNFHGLDTFTYQICDNIFAPLCDTAIVIIDIESVNDLPTVSPDVVTLQEDGSSIILVTNNDDFGGDGAATNPITITTNPNNGTATVDNNGTPNDPTDDFINYIPNPDYNGLDTLYYAICDFDGDCDTAFAVLTVMSVNDLPIANLNNSSTQEDTPVNITVLNNDDFGGDGASTDAILITTQPINGVATVNINSTPNDPTDDTIDYQPNMNYNGLDSLIYEICDVDGDCDTAWVVITIQSVNDLPIAYVDTVILQEDGSSIILAANNDDFGGDGPATNPIAITTNPNNGTATVDNNGTPNDPTDDFINYIPNPDYNGLDTVYYAICDFDGDCDATFAVLTVLSVNDLPIANLNNSSTQEDTPVNIAVLNNDDFGGDGASTDSISITTQSVNGTASVNINGTPNDPTDDTIDYQPNMDYNGLDSLIYEICDVDGDCDTAWVVITIHSVNDLPIAYLDTVILQEDGSSIILAASNDDFGGDGPAANPITITTSPNNGTVTVDNNGTPTDPTDDFINYIPNPDYNGLDTLYYAICDFDGDCDTTFAVLTVLNVNDLPISYPDTTILQEDGSSIILATTNDDFGGDGPATNPITIITDPNNGTATVDNNGTPNDPTDDFINYIPNPDYNGLDTVYYAICDFDGDCDTTFAVLTVMSVNDLPIANLNNDSTQEDTPVNIAVINNDDFGGDGESTDAISITVQPANGIATINTNGTPSDPTDDTIDYLPNMDYKGLDSLIYEICDMDGDCDTAFVIITINSVNDFPIAYLDTVTLQEDGSSIILAASNDDFGGDGPADNPITIITNPDNGVATIDDNGTPTDPTDDFINYIPNPDYNGLDTIYYAICDFDGDCDTTFAALAVMSVNDVPIAYLDTVILQEDGSSIILAANNDDFGGDGAATNPITIITDPNNGTATVDNNGTPNDPTDDFINYIPTPDYNGLDTVYYAICDFDGDCDTTFAVLTVMSVNDLPVSYPDTTILQEDGSSIITATTNDDFGGDGAATNPITITTDPNNGTATVDNNGTPTDPTDDFINYIPNPDYNGLDTVYYTICDFDGDCDTTFAVLTVMSVNDLPVSYPDTIILQEDGSSIITATTNDDFGGDGPATNPITIITDPNNGTATVDNNGTPNDPTDDFINYVPNPDYNGLDTVYYAICDFDGDCDTTFAVLTVMSVNDLPIANLNTGSTQEDTQVNIAVLNNDDFGGDGESTDAISITVQPANGIATINTNGTPSDPTDDTIDYLPNMDYKGLDSLIYEICDMDGDCDTAFVIITINSVNDFPIAYLDTVTLQEDGSSIILAASNDDFGGDGPADNPITIITNPDNGVATIDDNGTPTDPTDDFINYIPNPDYNGLDTIHYAICDFDGDCDTTFAIVTVMSVNDAPIAYPDTTILLEDGTSIISVTANDDFGGDGPSTTPIIIITNPTSGTATIDDNGTPNDPTDDFIHYVPNPDYNGLDTVIYAICDVNGDCDTAFAELIVTSVNDAPVAYPDTTILLEDETSIIAVTANDDFGGDGPSTTPIIIITNPINGIATIDDNGTPNDPTDDFIHYVPNPDYNGLDTVIYAICDVNGDCDTAFAELVVTSVNDAPVAYPDTTILLEDGTSIIAVTANDDFGGDGPSTTPIIIITNPINGIATIDNNGTPNDPTDDFIHYVPNPDYNGLDTVIYAICDVNGDCDTAFAELVVTSVNDVPVAYPDTTILLEDGTSIIAVTANDDFGGDGPSTTPIIIITNPTDGTATIDDNGTPNDPTDDFIHYIPNPDYTGLDTIIYAICDVNGDCDTAFAELVVTSVNDVPVANANQATTDEDTEVNIAVLNNDSFGGDAPSESPIIITTATTNGTATVNDGGTPTDPTDDTIDYQPNPDFNGLDSLVYEICDIDNDCGTALVVITIDPINDGLVARNDYDTTLSNTAVIIAILENDMDSDGALDIKTLKVIDKPENGKAKVDKKDGLLEYEPNKDFFGLDSLTYQICDDGFPAPGKCDTATVFITVIPNFDLALIQTLMPGQGKEVKIGEMVDFKITVYNQGNLDAYNIELTEYIPAGLNFDAALNTAKNTKNKNDWNTDSTYVINALKAGKSMEIVLLAMVDSFTVDSILAINGEISFAALTPTESATDSPFNGLVNFPDMDSKADDIYGNDVMGGDNLINNEFGDEDDADYAYVLVEFTEADPLGYIYCDKTGKILTGGTISITGPGMAFILADGSQGMYQWITDGTPGVYTMTYNHPNGYPMSVDCLPLGGAYDPTNRDGTPEDVDGISNNNIVQLGTEVVENGYLVDTSCTNNPFYVDFDLASFDPIVSGNNIPVQCVFISSIVCEDENNNGQPDAGEQGLAGINVYLYNCADTLNPVDSVLTDANGKYSFDGLITGDYMLQFAPPKNVYRFANENMPLGIIEARNGFSECISLAPGQCDTTTSICLVACPAVNITATKALIYNGETIELSTTGGGTYQWTPTEELNCATCETVIATPSRNTTYNVVADDTYGCVNEATIDIEVDYSLSRIEGPCSCEGGNNDFEEQIVLLTTRADANWTIKENRLFDNTNSQPYPIGTTLQADGIEGDLYRYILTGYHNDGAGYEVIVTNGIEDIIISNTCFETTSCLVEVISAPDATPVVTPVCNEVMNVSNTPAITRLTDCEGCNFSNDGIELYTDTTARNNVHTLCPQNRWQRITVNFSEFELAVGDTLFVFAGTDTLGTPIAKMSGVGVSAANGGWINGVCDPKVDTSGCLTFQFKTNGDNNKGIGWKADFTCGERDIQLTAPNDLSAKLDCEEVYAIFDIKPATVTADCGTVQDSQIVRIYNTHRELCLDTCLAITDVVKDTFAIGSYFVEYKLKSDTTKLTQSVLSVQGASLVCNDEINIPLGSACSIMMTPDDLLESTCDTITDTLYYFITLKGVDKNGQPIVLATGGGKGGDYPILTKEMIDGCGGSITANIERRYYEDLKFTFCNNGQQTTDCEVKVNVIDQTPPTFTNLATVDTFKLCTVDLTPTGLGISPPAAFDNCDSVAVAFVGVTIIDDGSVCDTTRATLNWTASDACGNIATLAQSIVILRPTIADVVQAPEVTLSCGEDEDTALNDLTKTGMPGIKVGRVQNGVLIPMDTIALDTANYVCGYLLQYREVPVPADCGTKLFRYWDVVDWCDAQNGILPLDTQYIELKDTLAPTFVENSLATKTLELPHDACTFDITQLENPAATDNCSAVSVSMDQVFRIVNGARIAVPTAAINALDCDSFEVRWIAEDACHEQLKNATITQLVIIEDNTLPAAICTDKINYSLSRDEGSLHYQDIDAGSNDACGISKYEVSRDEVNWDSIVIFTCEDAHAAVKVYLRVTDVKGNQNTCWTMVNVEDKIRPICSDLPDQTLTCNAEHFGDELTNTDVNDNKVMDADEWIDMTPEQAIDFNEKYGNPDCSDNVTCRDLVIEQQYQFIEKACGVAHIKRRYRAIDWDGAGFVSNWATQNINIEYKANWSITLPTDWKGNCGASIPESEVLITNGACDLMGYEVEEKVYSPSGAGGEDACLKVVRTYTIINWCKYESGQEAVRISRTEDEYGMVTTPKTITSADFDSISKLEYIQILKIVDDTAPVITVDSVDTCIESTDCQETKRFAITANDCNAAGTLALTYNWMISSNGVQLAAGEGSFFDYPVVPKVTYDIKWMVADDCANTAWEELSYEFSDCKKPAPSCLHGIAVDLMQEVGMIQIWAKDINHKSTDNCTPEDRLSYRIWHRALGDVPTDLAGVEALPEAVTLDCAYSGTQIVHLYIIDEAGNWDFCSTYVNIQDNTGACDNEEPEIMATVSGTIVDWKANQTVKGVDVLNTNATSTSTSMKTAEDGLYDFELAMYSNYTIQPEKDDRPLNGVSTFDLVLITKHILGQKTFTNPYQLIAADVNNSGTITAFDMVQTRKLILAIDSKFTNNTSWRFVDAAYEFTTEQPLTEDFPEMVAIIDLSEDMEMDFVAIKIGDVSGNARTNSLAQAEDRTTGQNFEIFTADRMLKAGKTYTVTFSAKQLAQIQGYQFTLGYDNLKVEKLQEGVVGRENFGLHKMEEGMITTSWNKTQSAEAVSNGSMQNSQLATRNSQLFTLEFTALADGKLSEQLSILNRPTAIEAYDSKGELMDVKLTFTSPISTERFELFQNQPNPFQDRTLIGFYLPGDSEVQLILRDETGRVLKSVKQARKAGYNSIQLEKDDLINGFMYYQLSTKFGTQSKKMLRLN